MTILLAVHKECQSPTLNKIRRRLRDGELGDLSHLSTEHLSDRPPLDAIVDQVATQASIPGGGPGVCAAMRRGWSV
ncbi:hypothetical protein [Streptomyces aurantiacus]|uniref:hypothetical protein n=1 Tax=Streptomyces aurantiacus TaxID=47760 RepID=UPI0012FEE175|nr:hypothetical protein [Streptomyces aurantiacus]